MAITTYSELQTAVANWLKRSNLGDRIPEFITLAEQRIIRGTQDPMFSSQPLDTRDMYTTATLSTVADQDYISLPSGFRNFKGNLYVSGNLKARLTQESLDNLNNSYGGSITGQPVMYSVAGDRVYIAPTPDGVYSIPVVYKSFTALSDAAPTNSTLTNFPNVYLYGALLEGSIYTRRPDSENIYRLFAGAIDAANREDKIGTYSGSVPTVRTDTGSP